VSRVRFIVYRAVTPRRLAWIWNDYREVLTDSGVGVRIGGALQVGYRVFSLVWRRLPRAHQGEEG
jgi:hypothetical protein